MKQCTEMSNRKRFILCIFLIFFWYKLIFNSISNVEDAVDIKWYRNSSRNASDYIFPNENSVIIEPSKVCRSDECDLVIIAVTSAPRNYQQRQAIRATWGNTSYFNYDFVEKIHGKHAGKYLDANLENWLKYSDDVSEHVVWGLISLIIVFLTTKLKKIHWKLIKSKLFLIFLTHKKSNLSKFRIKVVFLLGKNPQKNHFDDHQLKINDEGHTYGIIFVKSFS